MLSFLYPIHLSVYQTRVSEETSAVTELCSDAVAEFSSGVQEVSLIQSQLHPVMKQ
jgi:hypothetical protein